MGGLEHNRSLWVEIGTGPEFSMPSGDVEVDVAVVGAGITGLTTAALLQRDGASVAVVEAGRVAMGATGYTTAKVTALHGLIYASLLQSVGQERAAAYAAANQAAIAQIADLVVETAADCDFERAAAYTYTEQRARVAALEAEVEAGRSLGLDLDLVTDTTLPFSVAGAVRLEHQAQFHPRRYCLALAQHVAKDGSFVFEHTRAVDVTREAGRATVVTDHGLVRAQRIVLATHLPFLNAGAYFARAHPYRSYVLALRLNGESPDGMYISAEQPTRSVRRAGAGEFLLVGGESHKTGQDPDTTRRYAELERWARDRWSIRAVAHRWSAQDYVTLDGLPYVGSLTAGNDHILIATGFRKWGMTNGTAAAMLLADRIAGREHPAAFAFDSTRLSPRASVGNFVCENANVAKRLIGDRLAHLRPMPVDELAPGVGAIVDMNGTKAAAFRDESGGVHAVSATCTHLGCQLTFNDGERSWDCPCHGSRFDLAGKVIEGPAVRDLQTIASATSASDVST